MELIRLYSEEFPATPGMPVPASLRDMVRPHVERILRKKKSRRASQASREAGTQLRPKPIPYEGPPGPRAREYGLEALVIGDPALARS